MLLYPNFTRCAELDTFTSHSLYNTNYVYFGGDHGFARGLIESYMCQLVGSSLSWNKYVDGCNLEAFNRGGPEQSNWQNHFSHWILKYYLVQFDLCIGSKEVVIPKANEDFDRWAWELFPRLLTSFVYLWTNHKSLIGPCNNQCTRCVVIDGHQKCRRRVCRAKEIEVHTSEFDSIKVGCCRTPIRGSHHCKEHTITQECTDSQKPGASERQRQTKKNGLRHEPRKRGSEQFGATNCRTLKEQSEKYINRCSRSFGVIAAVSNCKIVLTFSEIFRSETLREIIHVLCSTVRGLVSIALLNASIFLPFSLIASAGGFPNCAVYDDGCHLVEFLKNHLGRDLHTSTASQFLYNTKFSVDRVHFKNHVGKWCRRHMNPDDNRSK